MVSRVAKWGNSQGIRLEKRMLHLLGLCVGDTIEITKKGEDIIIRPTHNIDWYLQGYERPESDWEAFESQGREIW